MKSDRRRVQRVFLEAVKVSNPAGREAVLDSACASDTLLRREVAALLHAHDLPNNALDTPALDVLSLTPCEQQLDTGATDADSAIALGTVIAGRYRLLDRIGEGGMGVVYRAEQIAPMRRTVAVKVIKPGFGSKNTMVRFAAERQALALMDHPNIARILDAGTIESPSVAPGGPQGRPYFVMELVEGVAINKFCTQHQLDLRQRLKLFVPLTQAIQHAHQRGIIHRDLKPANILVVVSDGKPTPVVIDFGIAKSTGESLGDGALETCPGLLMGSIDYMAPEQAEQDARHVDTRTDVYALGAVLYELVCGSTLFDRERVRDSSLFGVASMICEEVPPPPSERALRSTAAVVDAKLGSPVRLSRQLRGELDWIVMKCLEKDRDRRYAAASELADDIERHLHQLPVNAGPPSARYRIGKFVRRHRGSVAAACLALVSLISGIAGMSWGLVHAWRAQAVAVAERDEKVQALKEEERQRFLAVQERQRADGEAKIAKAVASFLQNDLLRLADPQAQVNARFEPDPNLTVRAALDRAAASVERRFSDQPVVEAAIRRTIGRAYDGLGEFGKAIHHLTKSAAIYDALNTGEAEMLEESARYDLGISLRHANRTDEAIPLLERAHAVRAERLGVGHRQTLIAASHLATAYEKAGRTDDSYRLFSDVYDQLRESESDPVSIMAALNNLACLDANRGRVTEAIKRLEELNELWSTRFGATAPPSLEMLLNLGQLYLRANRWTEAIATLENAQRAAQAKLSAEHPSVMSAAFFLAEAHARSGQSAKAGGILEDCRARVLAKVGPTHVRYHAATIELAIWAAEAGHLEQAKNLAENTLKALAPVSATAAYTKASAQWAMARVLLLMGKPVEAEPLARDAVAVFAARRPDDWNYADARVLLGLILMAQNNLADAEPLLTDGVTVFKRMETQLAYTCRRKYPEALAALAACADARHADDEAAHWRAEQQRVAKAMHQ